MTICTRNSDARACRHPLFGPAADLLVIIKMTLSRPLTTIALLAVSCLLIACTSYRAMPITPDRTAADLAMPTPDRLLKQISELKHPLLTPVPFDPHKPYSADVVAVLAVILNPNLRSTRDQHAIQSAQVLQAGILPNPQLSASFSEPFTGDPNETTVGFAYGLSWEFTALIARQSRRDAAIDASSSVDLQIAWLEWQTAMSAQQTYYRYQGARERLDIAEAMAERAEHFAISQRKARDDGWLTTVEISDSDSIAHDLRAQALDLVEEVANQRSALIRIIGLPSNTDLTLAPAHWRTVSPSLDDAESQLESRRLDLQALRMAYLSQEQTVHAAVLGQFPRISLQFTHQRDTGDIQSYGPGLTIDLPLFDRNQGVIASETATRQRLYDEYLQRVFESRHDLSEAVQACNLDAERIRVSDGRVRELAQRAMVFQNALPQGLMTVSASNAAAAAWDNQRLESLLWRERLAEATISVEIVAGRYLPQATRVEP
jgi:cobalt-zinc-cadmium efflux system outer membrane protein